MKRILTALVLSISILFASGGFVFAQDFLKGVEAWEKGDFATALREWSALAEQGNTLAVQSGLALRRWSRCHSRS